MVGVLIRMRLRVLRHSLRGKRAVIFVLGAVYGFGGGIASALLPLVAGTDVEVGTDVLGALFALWALGWFIAPVLTGGGDETLRPENFALLPLSSRSLARGLLVSSLVGIPPAATLLGFLGAVLFGARLGALPALVAAVGLVLELGFVLVLSRVVTAALGAVLNSRRGRDLGVVAASLVVLVVIPMRYVFQAVGPVLLNRSSPTLSAVVRAVPSGWAAVAVRGAATGDALLTVGPLLGLVVLVTVLGMAWAALLRRRLTAAGASAAPSAGSRRAAGRGTHRTLSPAGAVVVRELRLWWRDARRRSLLLTSILLGVAIPVFSFAGAGSAAAAYTAVWLVGFATMQVGNLYGLDGGSLWHVLATPGGPRADVRGRQGAWLVIIAPLGVLAAVLAPLVTGAPSAYPWLAGLVPVLLGAGAGLIVLQSAYLPFAMPQRRGQNPFAGNAAGTGPGCVRGLMTLAYTLLLAPAALPVVAVVLAGELSGTAWLVWLGAPIGIAVGATLAWWWGRLAHRRVTTRGPEILGEVRTGP